MKKNPVPVLLDERDWGQILDGLRCRLEAYEETVRYYETDNAKSEIVEVRDGSEARELADRYRGIIERIQQALRQD